MKKIAIVFPGQGAQYTGMGESFYKNYMICRQTYEEASEESGIDIAKLCFSDSIIKLNRIEEMQLAVVTTDVAIARAYFNEYGVPPQFCLGHSVGEYAALTCAGAVTFADTIKILKYRGKLLRDSYEKNTGVMVVVENIDKETAGKLIAEHNLQASVFIASYNSSRQILVSGREKETEQFQEILLDANARITPLLSSPPMHSPLLQPYADDFRDFLEGIRFYPFRFPVISNLTGRPFSDPAKIPEILSKHLTNPVLWEKSVECCGKYGVNLMIEAGPKNLLINLLRDIVPNMTLLCYGQKKDRELINEEFSGDANYKKDVPEFLGRCLGIAVSTKNSNPDSARYEEGVVAPYRQLKKMQETIREAGNRLTREDMSKALKMLKQILDTKQVDIDEQKNWFTRLLDETNTYYLLKEELA
jgi:[acyl-carrier-protein] S-malonyltransferase